MWYGFNKLQIITNEAKIIEELSIGFPMIIDRAFYNKMINSYNYPNSILIKAKKIYESKGENVGEFNQTLAKRLFSLIEGKFEDKPLYILWNKGWFQIRIIMYY